MQPVLNVEDIRSVEADLTEEGVSVSELMHRAGVSTAREVMEMGDIRDVVVLSGFGNNGGDGWVAAEELLRHGVHVSVVSPVVPDDIHGDIARVVATSARGAGVHVVVAPPRQELEELLSGVDVIIDAILGTGFHGEPRTPFDIWIDCVNESGMRIVSVDVPSGLSAQTGLAAGPCVSADLTITSSPSPTGTTSSPVAPCSWWAAPCASRVRP